MYGSGGAEKKTAPALFFFESFTCMPLKKMVLTCVPLKKFLAPVCHRAKLICPLCHSVQLCK
jgi:hypothetical protein